MVNFGQPINVVVFLSYGSLVKILIAISRSPSQECSCTASCQVRSLAKGTGKPRWFHASQSLKKLRLECSSYRSIRRSARTPYSSSTPTTTSWGESCSKASWTAISDGATVAVPAGGAFLQLRSEKGLNHLGERSPPKASFIPSQPLTFSHVGSCFLSRSMPCRREKFGVYSSPAVKNHRTWDIAN